MANFVIVLDPQADRRNRFVSEAQARIAPSAGLTLESCRCGPLAAVSARGAGIPFSRSVCADGMAWLFGDAVQDDDNRVSANQLRELWPDEAATRGAFDGYFAGFVYDAARGLTVGADVLGTFPLYYCELGDVLLVGASPELFRLHPCFNAQLSAQGLAGILLTNGLVQNRALLQGVRRLTPGHLLHWASTNQRIREIANRLPQPSDRYRNRSDLELLDVADEAFTRILRRHAPQGQTALLLSGGLDSRLVAGYLHRLGHAPKVLTFGEPDDLEVQAGQAAALALGWSFHNRESSMPLELAVRGAIWEHLSGGFSALGAWEEGTFVKELAPRFWSGYSLDQLLGGSSLTPSFDARQQTCTWERIFQKITHWGMPPAELAGLLVPLGGVSLVDEVVASLWRSLRSFTGEHHQQIIQARLTTRMRFHQGTVVWRKSFSSWPIMPWLDRRFLETILDLPAALLLKRRLERELLRTRFPTLARIPLDTNSWRFTPLVRDPAPLWQRVKYALPIVRRWQAGWRPWKTAGAERRRYHRMFDLNGSEWKAVRRHAEPYRRRLAGWCQPDELDRLLPGPDKRCVSKNTFSEDSRRRNLLGLMLWAGNQ